MLGYGIVFMQTFGSSILQLTTIPGVVGGKFAGAVRIPWSVRPESGFRITLRCTEENECNRKQHVAWEEEQLVPKPIYEASGRVTIVPVSFAIPYACSETSRPGSKFETEWQLVASARCPGVNYLSQFRVPIFKTTQKNAAFNVDEQCQPAEDTIGRSNSDLLLREAGIQKESFAGGRVRLTFKATRNLGLKLFVTVGVFVLCGLIGIILYFNRSIIPWLIGLGWGLILGKLLVSLWFNRSVVEASPEGLTISRGLFGTRCKQFIAADQIDDFAPDENTSWKCPTVVLRDENEITLAQGIGSILVERAVFDELDRALGRSRS
jgi:hypothetical protein